MQGYSVHGRRLGCLSRHLANNERQQEMRKVRSQTGSGHYIQKRTKRFIRHFHNL